MIYRFCRRIRTALYNVFVQPAIRRSFAACGRGTRIGRGGDFYPFSHIRIGDRVSIGPVIGPHVTIITGNHRIDAVGKYITELTEKDKRPEDDSDVTIGTGAWIGANVIILKGVHVGRESVVAAGSVVTHDVPPYTIVGGVPARYIRDRFTPDEWKRHVTILQDRAKDGSVPSPAPDSSDASPVHPDGSGNRT